MIEWIMKTFTGTPLAIVLVGAYFVVFAPFAWLGLGGRLFSGRFKRGEWIVLVVFVLCVALEWIQYATKGRIGAFAPLTQGDTWGLVRYFGTFAPLLWLWLAWLLSRVWKCGQGKIRLVVRMLIVGTLGWLGYSQCFSYFKDQMTASNAEDVWLAAKRVAPIIKADYKGPARRTKWKNWGEYHSLNRPAVFGGWGAAAWEVRGSSESPNRGVWPGFEDYLFVRVGEGYYGKTKFEAKKYDYVAKVNGLFAEWVLLRRKGAWK